MSSPFRLFRRHQKVMMVVLVGLSMLAFVVCSSIPDPTNIPGPLMVALLALAIGSIGWLWGLNTKKSSEFGAYGLLIGAVGGLLLAWNFSPTPAIQMAGGDISNEQLAEFRNRRELANRFIVMVQQRIREDHPTAQIRPMNGFGDTSLESMAFAEALRREADRLGVVGNQETVTEFLMGLTHDRVSNSSLMTGALMRAVVRDLGSSEQSVYAALLDEWRMAQARSMMNGGDILTPDSYWDAYRKLNVQQDMELAVLPASDFVNESVEPSDPEVLEYFNQYRDNFPNFTPQGVFEEGRPGFMQPRRIQCVYIEGAADQFLGQVTVTPEEIDAEYIRRYPPQVEETPGTGFPGMEGTFPGGPMMPDPFLNGPTLPPTPGLPFDITPGTSDTPAPVDPDAPIPESPDETSADGTETSPASEPTEDGPTADESTPVPTDGATNSTPAEPEADGVESTESPTNESTDSSCDDPVTEESPTPEGDGESQPAEATETDPSGEPGGDDNPPVDEPTVEPTAEDAAATETAAGDETPATTEETTSPDADVGPAPFTLSESLDPPPPPLVDEIAAPPIVYPPPLTDELRIEIEEYLVALKADMLLQEQMQAFISEFDANIGRFASLPPDNERFLSTQAAFDAARLLATEAEGDDDEASFDFYFVQTDLQSSNEMEDSEEFPIGSAVQTLTSGAGSSMTTVLFDTVGRLYRPLLCESPTRSSPFDPAPPPPESRYVVWKIADIDFYAPESIDDNREGMAVKIREQVIDAWQLDKARVAVEQRAEQLLEIAQGSTEPFSALFSETERVEGGGLTVTVIETGLMSWYRLSTATANDFGRPPPVLNTIPGLPDVTPGDSFMQNVFLEMNVGDTKAVWNQDRTYLFVVRVTKRFPSTPEEWNASRNTFMAEIPTAISSVQLSQFGIPPLPVWQIAEGYRRQYLVGGVDLFEKYEIVIPQQSE